MSDSKESGTGSGKSNQEQSATNKQAEKPSNRLELLSYYLFLLVASIALIALVSLIYSITIREETVQIRSVVTETVDRTTKMILLRDTAHVVDPGEYERLLTQLREQNQFLTSMLGTIATFGTVVTAFIALFVWRIQKKYELFDEGHGKAIKLHAAITVACDDASSRIGELTAISRELEIHESTIENYVERIEAAIDVFNGSEIVSEEWDASQYDPDIEPDDLADMANEDMTSENQSGSDDVSSTANSVEDDDDNVDASSSGELK